MEYYELAYERVNIKNWNRKRTHMPDAVVGVGLGLGVQSTVKTRYEENRGKVAVGGKSSMCASH